MNARHSKYRIARSAMKRRRGNCATVIEKAFAIFIHIRQNPCCSPSEVAREFSETMTERSVYRYLKVLTELGMIERTSRPGDGASWNAVTLETMD